MPPVTCRRCKGSRGSRNRKGQWFDCSACNGTGINYDLWETHCKECYTPIVYKRGQSEPQYCKNCRNKEKTKTCAQHGCGNTIRYKLGWTDVSDYCGSCRKHRERGDNARMCTSCGNLIWVPWNKNFTKCRDCNERERAQKAAQWKTKSCSKCGGEIKYHVDWNKVPDICNNCKEKEKAKWREKPCATSSCNNKVKYNTDWEHPPSFCSSCKQKRDRVKGKRTLGANDVLPGSGTSPSGIGCTHATVSGPNSYGGQHVTVYNRNLANHEHYSYDTDIDGNYVSGSAHYTDAMAEVLRKHGHHRT